MSTPDDELLARCRRGDRQAWEDIVHRYHRLVRSIAVSYGLRGDDIDEVVQVVFEILVAQLDRFHPDTRLAAWLATVTRRHVWRTLEQRRREVVDDGAGAALAHRDVDEHIARGVDAAWLRAGLAELSGPCRSLLESLYLYGERPYVEIAAELGIPVGSIGPRRARCLAHLRRVLDATAAAPAGAPNAMPRGSR